MPSKPEIPKEFRNSTEPQHFAGTPGLYQEGKKVKEEAPKPIAALIDESKLKPGEAVPLLPAGTHVASEADLSREAVAGTVEEPEPPQEAKT